MSHDDTDTDARTDPFDTDESPAYIGFGQSGSGITLPDDADHEEGENP